MGFLQSIAGGNDAPDTQKCKVVNIDLSFKMILKTAILIILAIILIQIILFIILMSFALVGSLLGLSVATSTTKANQNTLQAKIKAMTGL